MTMPLLRNLLLTAAALAVGASAIPQRAKPQDGVTGSRTDTNGLCEIPIGNCTPFDGELGCEFCCVGFEPAPGSVCHIDLEYSGWCGSEGGDGIIFHCGTHDL